MGGPQGKQSLWTAIYLNVLYLFATIISIVGFSICSSAAVLFIKYLVQAYIVVGDPVFHHVAYGVIVTAIIFQAFYVLK